MGVRLYMASSLEGGRFRGRSGPCAVLRRKSKFAMERIKFVEIDSEQKTAIGD